MLTDLSDFDRRALERLRLARLTETIEPVTRTITLLDANNVFHLYCQSEALVDELLVWDVAEAALLILGCQAVNIWFADEMVWTSSETELCFSSEHLDIEFVRESEAMTTATLERNSVESIVQEAIAPVIDETIDRVIDDYLNGNEMSALIRQRVQQKIQARLSASTNSNSNGKAETVTPTPVATVEAPESKPAAKKPAARKTAAKKAPAKRTSTRAKKTATETK